MTISSDRAVSPFASRVIYLANMASAVCGGLALVLAVTAPHAMRTTTWASISDAMVVANMRGGLPFLFAVSIVLSRWFLRTGAGTAAAAIAAAPLFLAAALLTLGIAGGMPRFTDAVFGLGTKGVHNRGNGDAAATGRDIRSARAPSGVPQQSNATRRNRPFNISAATVLMSSRSAAASITAGSPSRAWPPQADCCSG